MTRPAPVAIDVDGHRTLLKWHRGRRTATDAPFTPTRIADGLRAGASVEIDLRVHAPDPGGRGHGFVVLHDDLLDHATTGTGPVALATSSQLRRLHLRDNDSRPTTEPVLLLADLAALLADIALGDGAMLQLDFKDDASVLDAGTVANFADAVSPVADAAILSCGDAAAVRILTDAVPALHVGYDPCHHGAIDRVLRWRTYRRFVDDAIAKSPRAEMIYLDKRLVLTAADRGVDLIGAFHRRERAVDVYTVADVDAGSVAIIRRLGALGADQITTDDPQRVVELLG
ncbi:glycerophosphodiester phosphodiesterase [Gordonia desulfuricans]|uniref:Glycerophosphodiester phosphodiesterase n=1 Tax=Gordonia desulfuricans TaxID=89051 RepID=A0A7K3LKF8_9ACTN|nr:glycerophosphodiester phosphodiesterase family protein [Gordonia desulfuricans]NDK88759.1 glycerophosphodiester phosphodiesterase [Gordonia desulfuricans]